MEVFMHVNVAMQWTLYTRVIDMPYWQQRLVLPKSNTHCKLKSIQSTCLSSLPKFHTLLQLNRSSTKSFMSCLRESMNSFFLNMFMTDNMQIFAKNCFDINILFKAQHTFLFLQLFAFQNVKRFFSDCDVLGFYYCKISVITHHYL